MSTVHPGDNGSHLTAVHHGPSLSERSCSFLPACYNFTLFFSLPFYPVCKLYRHTISYHGHLSLGLGSTVYQLHDPEKLRSSFLVSKMPITTWLFEDGSWFDRDPSSATFRHVHLYEKAEAKRTVIFYAALKNFPADREVFYANHFAGLERTFQKGGYRFSRFGNNCSRVINQIFYREKWLRKGPLDFLPAMSFKRLVTVWQKGGLEFITGCLNEYISHQFKPQKLCLGMFTLNPDRELISWLEHKGAHLPPASDLNPTMTS